MTATRLSAGSFVGDQSIQAAKLYLSEILGRGHLHMKQIVWKPAKCLKELYYQRNHQFSLQKSVMTQPLKPFPGSKTFTSRKQILKTAAPIGQLPNARLSCGLGGQWKKENLPEGRARGCQAGALRNWLYQRRESTPVLLRGRYPLQGSSICCEFHILSFSEGSFYCDFLVLTLLVYI